MADVIKCDICGTIVEPDELDSTYYEIEIHQGSALTLSSASGLPGVKGKNVAQCCEPTCVARAVGITWAG